MKHTLLFTMIVTMIAVLVLMTLASFKPADASTFTVVNDSVATDAVDATPGDGICATAGGKCTLRAAIQEANTLPGADIINVPAGFYTLTIPGATENAAASGYLDITSDLTINGAGAASTIIDGNGTDRIFDIAPVSGTPTVTIRGLEIFNGQAPSGTNTAGFSGGGIQIRNGTITLDALFLYKNVTGTGGSSSPIDPTDLTGQVGGCGGAIMIRGGTIILSNSTVNKNRAGNGGRGTSPFLNGTGGPGAGMCVLGGNITLRNDTILGNRTGAGGAPLGAAVVGANGGPGGGIAVFSGTFNLNNVTLTKNDTGPGGPGTTAGLPGSGGGIAQQFGGIINIKNSIIALNTVLPGGTGPNCIGAITSQGNNLLGNNAGCTFSGTSGVNGDAVGTAVSPIDPLFNAAGLADNGGPTTTFALQAGSPAKDTGNNSTCEPKDQRGEARPVSGPGICDKGAFEITACGDGAVQTGEACDDGNTSNSDACLNTCVAASCGDGIVRIGVEACDDGNAVNNDGCTNACALPTCGDGIVQSNEDCDDGNTINNDSCTNTCKLPICGDGIVQSAEDCDDGNSVNNDGCTNACKLPFCGDGIVQSTEDCDTGNGASDTCPAGTTCNAPGETNACLCKQNPAPAQDSGNPSGSTDTAGTTDTTVDDTGGGCSLIY